MNDASRQVFVVCNPVAGQSQVDQIYAALKQRFSPPDWSLETYETTGKEDVSAISRDACQRGVSLVIAAGGDGTVVNVANGLIKTATPLGILPLGTGNGLARALNIPLELDQALDLLIANPKQLPVDALQVEQRHFFLNVSVGISPQLMQETKSVQKRRFGLLAYLWTLLKRSSIFQLHHYQLTVDGRLQRVRAAEVLISNISLLDKPARVFGPIETICDQQMDAYLVAARNFKEYARLVWNLFRHPGKSAPRLYHLVAKESIRIEANTHPQLVQGDGEVIGRTPVEIRLVPQAVSVLIPASDPAQRSS
ncbi:diacylglycerol kinase (ATP) [Thermoflexales bacterium]|nr:diacylglycerol kinase (ATP) [Thermoflexales bacterium]